MTDENSSAIDTLAESNSKEIVQGKREFLGFSRGFFVLQATFFCLVCVSILFPFLFVLTFAPIAILSALFFTKNVRFNAIFLVLVLTLVCIISGGDFVYVTFTALTLSCVLGAIWGLKIRHYILSGAIAIILSVSAVLFPTLVFCTLKSQSPADFVTDYAEECFLREELVFSPRWQVELATNTYFFIFEKTGELERNTDETFSENAKREFLIKVWDWGENLLYYDLMAIGATGGILVFLSVFIAHQKRKMPFKESKNNFKVNTIPVPFYDMRFNRKFLARYFCPLLLFSFIGYFGSFSSVTTAVFNSAVTIPCTFAAFALAHHSVRRIKKRLLRCQMMTIMVFLAVACLLFPLACVVVSLIGVADALLNVRRMLDFALDEGEFKK